MSKALLVLAFLGLGLLKGETPVVLEEWSGQSFGEADYKYSTAIFEIYLNRDESLFLEQSAILPAHEYDFTTPVLRLDEKQSSIPEPEIVLFDNLIHSTAVHTLSF